MHKQSRAAQGSQKKLPTLFSRLLIYFIIIMLVPILLLSIYFITSGNKTLEDSLQASAEQAIFKEGPRVTGIINTYRHKAYQVSTNGVIIKAIEADGEDSSLSSTAIYEELFSIMKGDVYAASALVVSASGRCRYSTHRFPQNYDLRYHQNDWNPFFNLSRSNKETASIITIENRYKTEQNAIVVVNILRRILDEAGNLSGYGVVDVFMDAFWGINSDFIFSDMVLIETDTFLASSLLYDKAGSFAKFPDLQILEVPFTERSYRTEGVIVAVYPIPNTSLLLAGIVETRPYTQSMGELFYIIFIVIIIGMAAATVLAYFFSKSIARPVGILVNSMQSIEQGNLDIKIRESNIEEIAQLDRSFNIMIKQIAELLELTREEAAKLREAERKSLESQMQPHFLYNTLNTVKSIAKLHGEEEILSIITRLGKLLKSSIDNRKSECPLKDSFALIEDYLTIQKIRFGSKLHVEMNIDERVLSYVTPKLIIQPIVENAIIHGLEPKTGDWILVISARLDDFEKMVHISVQDNGVGFSSGTMWGSLDELSADGHIGLYNVYRRIVLKYGERARFVIKSNQENGTTITLVFPAEEN